MRPLSRWSYLFIILAAFAVVIGIAHGAARIVRLHPWFLPRAGDHTPLVLAHQGGEALWPNNTMFAFQGAIQLGADVIDTDMHMTKDGVLVLMHDETVDRTTNGTGAIRDLTLAEIKALDAGYDFTTDEGKTFPYRGKSLQVPTLAELLNAFPDKRFGIEIKQTDPIPTAQAFCDLLRRYNAADRTMVSSFRQANMDAFRQVCPEVATSATENEMTQLFVLYNLGLIGTTSPNYQALQIPEERYGFKLLTPEFIAAAQTRGLRVIPWTIDETADLERIAKMGVTGINTNYPDRLLGLLGK